MSDLRRRIEAERENVERTLEELKTALTVEKKTKIELAAIAYFLHNIYNGIENILKQVIKSKSIKVHKAESWHKELLKISVAQGIIPEELARELNRYLAFRHYFIHSYGFMLEEPELKKLTDNIFDVWATFSSEIDSILKQSGS